MMQTDTHALRFPIVQFDKGQDDDVANLYDAEDRFISAARQIKAINPNAFCLYYQVCLTLSDVIDHDGVRLIWALVFWVEPLDCIYHFRANYQHH
jgi:hypothetical protein